MLCHHPYSPLGICLRLHLRLWLFLFFLVPLAKQMACPRSAPKPRPCPSSPSRCKDMTSQDRNTPASATSWEDFSSSWHGQHRRQPRGESQQPERSSPLWGHCPVVSDLPSPPPHLGLPVIPCFICSIVIEPHVSYRLQVGQPGLQMKIE